MTALALHARLVAGGLTLAVDDGGLVITPEPPAELDAHLQLLHTGVRALVTGRPWIGAADATAKRPWVGELKLAAPLPRMVGLVCVEGDTEWDRPPTDAALDNPELCEPEEAHLAMIELPSKEFPPRVQPCDRVTLLDYFEGRAAGEVE